MVGFRRSAFCHDTDFDHGGASAEDVTEDQTGSPEREIEVTSHPRETADLQILEPAAIQFVIAIFLFLTSVKVLTQEAITTGDDYFPLCRHGDTLGLTASKFEKPSLRANSIS